MKMKKIIFASVITMSLFFAACKKENQNSTLHLYMTDAPLSVEEVNIDLKGVEVNFNRDSTHWVTMQATPGIYNILNLQNGIDTLIAQGTYPTGVVKEIRLIVGDSNTIKADGQVYPLTIPSGEESGLKIKVDKNLKATVETVVIDFDAALSIQLETDGYKLRPVIRLK